MATALVALLWAGWRGGGHADSQRPPGGDRAAHRLLRQHAGLAGEGRRADELPGVAAAGARGLPGRIRAPGPALREAGRGAAARAESEPHATLPGDVRPAEHRHRLWPDAGVAGAGGEAAEER